MNTIKTTKFVYLLILCVSIILLLLPQLAAANYSVRPLVADFSLEPRGIANQTITIQNNSSRLQRVYATVNAVSVDGAGSITDFIPRSRASNTDTITSWIEISRARIEVAPQDTVEIPLRIQVHPQAKPGVYHAFIGLAPGRNREAAEEVVRSGQAPGTIVRIEIQDDRTAYLRLDNFVTDRFVFNSANSEFVYVIENPSDTALVPKGELIVYDSRGREVGAVAVNPENISIAPGDTHRFAEQVPDMSGLGRHRALLSINYGDGQRASLNDTIFFHQVPLQTLLLLFFFSLVVACAVAYVVHRRYAVVVDDHDLVALYHSPDRVSAPADHDVDLRPKNYEKTD